MLLCSRIYYSMFLSTLLKKILAFGVEGHQSKRNRIFIKSSGISLQFPAVPATLLSANQHVQCLALHILYCVHSQIKNVCPLLALRLFVHLLLCLGNLPCVGSSVYKRLNVYDLSSMYNGYRSTISQVYTIFCDLQFSVKVYAHVYRTYSEDITNGVSLIGVLFTVYAQFSMYKQFAVYTQCAFYCFQCVISSCSCMNNIKIKWTMVS